MTPPDSLRSVQQRLAASLNAMHRELEVACGRAPSVAVGDALRIRWVRDAAAKARQDVDALGALITRAERSDRLVEEYLEAMAEGREPDWDPAGGGQ